MKEKIQIIVYDGGDEDSQNQDRQIIYDGGGEDAENN